MRFSCRLVELKTDLAWVCEPRVFIPNSIISHILGASVLLQITEAARWYQEYNFHFKTFTELQALTFDRFLEVEGRATVLTLARTLIPTIATT